MSASRKLTHTDFLRFPEDGRRHELIDGVHYVTPSPNIGHQRVSMRLTAALLSALTGVGEVFAAPLDVFLSEHDIVEPDLMVVLHDQAADLLGEQHVLGAPAIVVEVASPGTRRRDSGLKRRLYERTGVEEYWQVNPADQTVVVLKRCGSSFASPVVLGCGDTLSTPLIPGLVVDVGQLFGAGRG